MKKICSIVFVTFLFFFIHLNAPFLSLCNDCIIHNSTIKVNNNNDMFLFCNIISIKLCRIHVNL